MRMLIKSIFLLLFVLPMAAQSANFCFTVNFSGGFCHSDGSCITTGYSHLNCVHIPDVQDIPSSTPNFVGGNGNVGGAGGAVNVSAIPVDAKSDESTCAPVFIESGLKHFTDIDYLSYDESGLHLIRNYSSFPVPVFVRSSRKGIFGTSWTSNFDERLKIKYYDGTVCDRGWNACTNNKVPQSITYITNNNEISFNRVNQNSNLYYSEGSHDEYNSPYASMDFNQLNGDINFKKKDGSVSTYDYYGQLKNIKFINNLEWKYTYDSSRNLNRVTHSSGKYLQFLWNSNNVVSQVILPNGKKINYSYLNLDQTSAAYVLNEIIFPDSAGTIKYVTNRQYDSFLVTEKHIDGKKWGEYSYAFNAEKKHAVVTSSGYVGGVEKSTFQYETNKTHVTNAKNATTTYNYDTNKRLTSVENPQSASCPALGNTYNYEGNSNRVSTKLQPDGTWLIQVFNVSSKLLDWTYNKGLRTVYTYSNHLQISTETIYEDKRGYDATCPGNLDCSEPIRAQPLSEKQYTYDPSHRRITSVKERALKEDSTYTDWRITTYDYDLHPNKLIKKMSVSGHLIGSQGIKEYHYSAAGDLTKVVHPNLLTESRTYVNNTLESVTNVQGITASYLYDGSGRTKKVTINNDQNLSVNYEYYLDGKIKSLSLPNGFNKTYTLDNARRVSKEFYSLDSSTPQTINYYYDLLSNLENASLRSLAQVPCLGGPSSPNQPNICNQEQPSLILVNRNYDANGNLHKKYEGQALSTYQYLRPGFPLKITDGNNKVSNFTYDLWMNLKSEKNSLNETSSYRYNAANRLKEVVDPKGAVTKYFWNGFSEIERIESADQGTKTFEYDNLGNVSAVIDALNTRVDYMYDDLSRLVKQKASSNASDVIDYTYDVTVQGAPISCATGNGKLCAVIGEDVASYFSYNVNGGLESQVDSIHGKNYYRTYGYDEYGKVNQITYPNGNTIKYDYYLDGTQKSVSAYIAGAWRLIATYEKKFDHISINYTYGISSSQKRFFHKDGRTASVSSYLLTKNYVYKSNTNLISKIENSASFNPQSLSAEYDDSERLTYSTLDGNFTYDANGNRASARVVGTGSYASYLYTPNTNRLATANAIQSVNTKSYVYNAAGNATEQNGSKIRRFNYDGFGRIKEISGNLPNRRYSYNYLNQRVYKNDETVPSQYRSPTRYFYNRNGYIDYQVTHSDSYITTPAGAGRIYIYLNGLLVSLLDGNTLSNVETDHLGRPEIVVQGNLIKWRAQNNAFGRIAYPAGITLDVGFPGQIFDSETGLWYNWHRYYDADIGRYIQSDPIGLKGGINTYAYVGNNPVNFVDPYGLFTLSLASGGNVTVGKGYGAQSGVYLTTGGNTSSAAAGGFVTLSKTTGFGAGLGIGVDLFKGGPETFNGESKTETVCIGPVCFSSHSNSDEWIGLGASIGGDSGGGAAPGGSFTHAENCTTSNPLIGGK